MTPADRVVLGFAVVFIFGLYAQLWTEDGAGARVKIKYDQHLVKTVSLNADQEIHVNGALGESVVEIKDQQVRFRSSPCSSQLCVLHGWMHQAGEVMACLPNRVIIEVIGKDKKFDAVSF
jgi:hypothetical protein